MSDALALALGTLASASGNAEPPKTLPVDDTLLPYGPPPLADAPFAEAPGHAIATPSWRRPLFALAAITLLGGTIGLAFQSARVDAPAAPGRATDSIAHTDASAEPITVSCLLDLQSENRERGRAIRASIEAAGALFDVQGGIGGKKLRFSFVDDQGRRDASLGALFQQARAAASVPILIGPILSDQAVAIAPLLEEGRMLAVSPSATMRRTPDQSRFFLRTAPDDTQSANALAALVARPAMKCTRIAVVSAFDAYASAYLDVLMPALQKKGLTAQRVEPVPPLPQKTYAVVLEAVKRTNATCEILVTPTAVAARYLLEAKASGRTVRVFGGDPLASEDFAQLARGDRSLPEAPSAAEGVMGVRARTAIATRPEYAFFARLMGRDGGTVLREPFAATAFDAAMLVGLALAKVGVSNDRALYRSALVSVSREGATYGPQALDELLLALRAGRDVDYRGASGEVDLDDTGDVKGDFAVYRIDYGRVVDVPEN